MARDWIWFFDADALRADCTSVHVDAFSFLPFCAIFT